MLNMQLQTLKQISMLAYFGDIQGICFHGRLECVRLWSADVKPSVLFYENKCEPVDPPKYMTKTTTLYKNKSISTINGV